MKLRIGFIGLGAMGLSHVQSIRRLCSDQAEIAALSDMTQANLQQALQIAPSAKVYRTAEELINSPLDAIFISTPNFTHADFVPRVLEAGKHLFLEKPCGISRDECRRVLEASNRSNRVLML